MQEVIALIAIHWDVYEYNKYTEYGVSSITEVKERRARFIIGLVTAWDCEVLYTLRTWVQRCRVVGLREPRKSDGSSD